jgi:hypothetical protein
LGKRDEEVRKEGGENERIGGQAATLLASWPAISSISLSTFTQIQTCPPDAPPIDKKAKAFFLFPFWNSFISFFIFSFYEMQGEKIKYAVKKDKRKMMGDEVREKNQNANGGRKAEKYGITTSLPPNESFTFIIYVHDFPHGPS